MIELFIYLTITMYILIKISLDMLQISYIRNASITNDELESFSINLDYFDKSNSYNIDKLNLSIVNMIVTSLMLVYFIFLGGIYDINKIAENIGWVSINDDLLLIIIFLMLALYQDLARRQDWLAAHHQNSQDIQASVDGYQ